MFTGIVEELGTITDRGTGRDGERLVVACSPAFLEEAKLGDSIAHNGCCLTVIELLSDGGAGDGRPGYVVEAVPETLERTELSDRAIGDAINLERPVRLMDRLGGHLVLGHVDATGTILDPAPNLKVSLPTHLGRYVVEKGSITVDGCSLTVVEVGPDWFSIALIPHTVEVTTFGHKRPGDRVNLEVDVMAKHAEKLISAYLPTKEAS